MKGGEGPVVFQDLLWKESIFAIKHAVEFNDFSTFRAFLEQALPQNSAYTRVRFTRSIIKWFFPGETLDQLTVRVWKAYQDDAVLLPLMRYLYLVAHPIIGDFVTKNLAPLQPGAVLPLRYFRDHMPRVMGRDLDKARKRLIRNLALMGFLAKRKDGYFLLAFEPPKTALLILLHQRFCPTPRTVAVQDVLDDPFWLSIGFKNPDEVRRVLSEASATGAIGKYVLADQLEQITTRLSLDEFIEQKIRL